MYIFNCKRAKPFYIKHTSPWKDQDNFNSVFRQDSPNLMFNFSRFFFFFCVLFFVLFFFVCFFYYSLSLLFFSGICIHNNPDQTIKQLRKDTQTILKSDFLSFLYEWKRKKILTPMTKIQIRTSTHRMFNTRICLKLNIDDKLKVLWSWTLWNYRQCSTSNSLK